MKFLYIHPSSSRNSLTKLSTSPRASRFRIHSLTEHVLFFSAFFFFALRARQLISKQQPELQYHQHTYLKILLYNTMLNSTQSICVDKTTAAQLVILLRTQPKLRSMCEQFRNHISQHSSVFGCATQETTCCTILLTHV